MDASPSAVDSSCQKVLRLRVSSAGTIVCRVCAVFSLVSHGCLWNVGLGPDSHLTQAPLWLWALARARPRVPTGPSTTEPSGAGRVGVAPASHAAPVMLPWAEVGGLCSRARPSPPGQVKATGISAQGGTWLKVEKQVGET